MGGERSRKRKRVYLCFAGLIFFSACTALVDLKERQEAQAYLRGAEGLLAKEDYEGSLRENRKVLSLPAGAPLADEALFNMGLIYAHPGNPKRDNGKAVILLRRIVEEFPRSPWADRAKILAGIFQGLENAGALGVKEEPVEVKEKEEAREALHAAETLLVKGDYEGSLRENRKVLSLAAHRPPADKALFNMGLIYAHPRNPKKDNGKAIALLKQLIKEYPQSFWVEQAKVWSAVIETFEKSKKVDIEIEEKRRDQGR